MWYRDYYIYYQWFRGKTNRYEIQINNGKCKCFDTIEEVKNFIDNLYRSSA